jgi:probable HAF family extracellular repeat protein
MKTNWIIGLVMCLAICATSAVAAIPPSYVLTDLGAWGTRAMDITDSGKVLIRSASNSSIIWDNGAVIGLGTYQGIPFEGEAMNEIGQVAGEVRVGSSFYHPAVWENGIVAELGVLGGHGGTSSTEGGMALDINSSGKIVGWSRTASGDAHAFLWTHGGTDGIPSNPQMKDLGPTKARGINNSGEVAGHTWEDTDTVGFLWHNDARTEFSPLGKYGTAKGNNENGDVVGYTHDGSAYHAFAYSGGTMNLFGPSTWGRDINDAGVVVGQIRLGSGDFRAGVSEGDMMRDLNELIPWDSGWILGDAHAINDVGQVVGSGQIGGSGPNRAFLLTPIPEPATLSILALGGLTMVRRRVRT